MKSRRSLDHGATGNGSVIALVSPTSAIEWLCMPRFDSPSVFGRLLDSERGGTFRFLFSGEERAGAIAYVRNTNVLRTVFDDGAGNRVEVIDFAPRRARGLGVEAPIEIVRVVRPISGAPRISVDFDPRPDYARARVDMVPHGAGLAIQGGSTSFHLLSNAPISYITERREITVREPLFFVFGVGEPARLRTRAEVLADLDETVAGWRAWSRGCHLVELAPEAVLRSALCLKMHTFVDTGAIIAAATTSIPEALGTERTWDYRYCWLRDSAFVVEAFRRLSQLDEGERFISYLRDVAESGPLQPLYGIGGERNLEEEMLPHLAGFADNGFVRVGNAAALQRQNDLHGELILCLEALLTDPRISLDAGADYFPLVERLVEEAIRAAPEPDTGIWEFRSILRHYTFSRAMGYVATSRGESLARMFGRTDLAQRWGTIAESEREAVLSRGYSPELGYFTQTLDGRFGDAANLLLPTLGVVDAKDPRFTNTLDAYQGLLVKNGLMLRYVNEDDFGETTSAFTMCSFWWAEALALAGRMDEALQVFNRLLRFANPLGLFSEDVDPATGALLGNFPQAYTHVGLINAAMTISTLLEAQGGRVRAWT